VEEMIREAIFEQFRQEIPYATQVEVIEFKEEPRIIKIVATVFAERQSQKGILVGPGGTGIRGFGTRARKQCENFFGKKIFLDLKVSVKKDWRKDEVQLKRFGYNKKK
jgi:GTP-binding protein Era